MQNLHCRCKVGTEECGEKHNTGGTPVHKVSYLDSIEGIKQEWGEKMRIFSEYPQVELKRFSGGYIEYLRLEMFIEVVASCWMRTAGVYVKLTSIAFSSLRRIGSHLAFWPEIAFLSPSRQVPINELVKKYSQNRLQPYPAAPDPQLQLAYHHNTRPGGF